MVQTYKLTPFNEVMSCTVFISKCGRCHSIIASKALRMGAVLTEQMLSSSPKSKSMTEPMADAQSVVDDWSVFE